MRWIAVSLTIVTLLAAACSVSSSNSGSSSLTPTASPTPLKPATTPEEAAERFLSHWRAKQYDAMYDLISVSAQEETDREKFVDRYEAIAEEATITGIDYELGALVSEEGGEMPATVTIHTSFFGDIIQENTLPLVRDTITLAASPGEAAESRQEWRLQWSPSLIFAELDDRSLIHLFAKVPRRGSILDRSGEKLAFDAEVAVVGIVPDLITDPEATISVLATVLSLPESEVRAQVETDLPSYYFIPIETLPYETSPAEVQKLRDLINLGVVVQEDSLRLYPQGSLAAHLVGYLAEVTADQLDELRAEGYEPGDLVGAFGLEGRSQALLAGERGGTLATVTPEGTVDRIIAEKAAKPGKDIYLSIDVNLQRAAETLLGERVGSVVVMDPRDNSVLALASYPRFDPNAFIRGLTVKEFNDLIDDERKPFLHRPLLATYPPRLHLQGCDLGRRPGRGRLQHQLHYPLHARLDGVGPGLPQE